MLESISAVEAVADRVVAPLAHLLHRGARLSPDQVSAASFGASVAAALAIGSNRLGLGLALMAVGQLLDGVDGAMARQFGLASPRGNQVDTAYDRASETAIFAGFAISGRAPMELVGLALVAILLLTTVAERSRVDLGVKRSALYFGHWATYPTLFTVIFSVNLVAYVVSLLRADIQFQRRMDALSGDLDTVASRAADLEAAERAGLTQSPAA
jgi:phosphatidylglycerophosphate synthase